MHPPWERVRAVESAPLWAWAVAARTFPTPLPALPLGVAGAGSIPVAPSTAHTLAFAGDLSSFHLGKWFDLSHV